MISKALRPAGQPSKHLKRVSHHLLGDGPDSSTGDQKQAHIEAIDKEASGEVVAKSGKAVKTHKHAKKKTAGKGKKPDKHHKDGKAGKGKKSQKPGKKGKAGAAKAAKPGKKEKMAAAEKTAASSPAAIAAAQTKPARSGPGHLTLVPALPEVDEADAVPLPETLPEAKPVEQQAKQAAEHQPELVASPGERDIATPASRRHVPVDLILVAGLITLFGLWGYRYWNNAHDVAKTTSPHRAILKQDQQDHEPVAAVSREEKAARSAVTTPATRHTVPAKVVAAHESKPELMAAKPQTPEDPVVSQAQPRFRPPSYWRYPPYPRWQRPPYYGNTLPPRFRQPLPTRFYPGQRAVLNGQNDDSP